MKVLQKVERTRNAIAPPAIVPEIPKVNNDTEIKNVTLPKKAQESMSKVHAQGATSQERVEE